MVKSFIIGGSMEEEMIFDEKKFEEDIKAVMEADNSPKKEKKRFSFKNIKKWSRRRKVITICAVIALAFLLRSIFGGKKDGSIFVSTEQIIRGNVSETLSLTGPVEGTDSVEVVSNIHAEILNLLVKEGDRVEKDQVLAVLDKADIEREAEIAKNAYEQALSTYEEKEKEVRNGYAKAREDLETARLDLERKQALLAVGNVAPADVEEAQNAYNESKRQADSYTLENGVAVPEKNYRLQIESAEYELEKKMEILEDTEIKSPIEGIVTRVNTKVGRFADITDDTNKPLFIIENLDVLEMKIPVSEYAIGKVKLDQKVEISADILSGESVVGRVKAISPTGERKDNSTTERVIPITINIEEKNTGLISGINAKANILIGSAEDVLIASSSSLIQLEEGIFVAVVKGGIVHMVKVETGVESDIQIELKPADGYELSEGDTIIANPEPGITDGMVVTPMPHM